MLLAAIENSTLDPLSWLPVVDYRLRSLWTNIGLSRLDSITKPDSSQVNTQSDIEDVLMGGTQESEEASQDISELSSQSPVVDEGIVFQGYVIAARSVFNELCLFVDGSAINIIALRFKRPGTIYGQSPPQRSQDQYDWYSMLYKRSPRCSDPDCNRLMPSPKTMRQVKLMRHVFSIGTRQARVGSKRVREMISKNRLMGYPCLIQIIIICG